MAVMTPQELNTFITSNPEALQFIYRVNEDGETYLHGDCVGCAKWCSENAPAVLTPTRVWWVTLSKLLGYAVYAPICNALKAAAVTDGALDELLLSLKPDAPGLDIGDLETHNMLDYLQSQSVLTADQVLVLKGLGMQRPLFAWEDIAEAVKAGESNGE